MPRFATTWLSIAASALVAGGCSTFGAAEQDLAAVTERTEQGPANQPASLSDAAESDVAAGDEARAVTVHVSDTDADAAAGPIDAATAYRSANDIGARSDHRRDGAGPNPEAANAPRGPSQDADKEQAETFDQLMTEARRRGALSASEEASFRRDLADVPAHLRPQMAAMLLAVRGRREEPVAASSPIGVPPLDRGSTMPVATTDLAANAATTTGERLARIAARTPTATSLDDNPLRALVAAAENPSGKTSPGAASSNATSPRIASSIALSASNQPGEVGMGPAATRSAVSKEASAPIENRSPVDDRFPVVTSGPPVVREAWPARRASDEATLEEWQVMLGATIRALEAKLAAAPDDKENPRRQALLRLLYLAANRLEDTAKAMPADAGEQQFWIDWLYGTSVYLDAEATPNEGQRAAIAAERLREAVHRLGEHANLLVSNVAFCRRVTSFGVYEPFTAKPGSAKYEFTANQEVLLYAEVRNFTSVPTAKGRHTLLRPSYQIFDAQGRRLGSVVELDESHDYCQSPRTDFFVCYHIYLPTRIDPGEYKLKLTIEDVHGGKVHENSVDFAIKRG